MVFRLDVRSGADGAAIGGFLRHHQAVVSGARELNNAVAEDDRSMADLA